MKHECEACGFIGDSEYKIEEEGVVLSVCQICYNGHLERNGIKREEYKQKTEEEIEQEALEAFKNLKKRGKNKLSHNIESKIQNVELLDVQPINHNVSFWSDSNNDVTMVGNNPNIGNMSQQLYDTSKYNNSSHNIFGQTFVRSHNLYNTNEIDQELYDDEPSTPIDPTIAKSIVERTGIEEAYIGDDIESERAISKILGIQQNNTTQSVQEEFFYTTDLHPTNIQKTIISSKDTSQSVEQPNFEWQNDKPSMSNARYSDQENIYTHSNSLFNGNEPATNNETIQNPTQKKQIFAQYTIFDNLQTHNQLPQDLGQTQQNIIQSTPNNIDQNGTQNKNSQNHLDDISIVFTQNQVDIVSESINDNQSKQSQNDQQNNQSKQMNATSLKMPTPPNANLVQDTTTYHSFVDTSSLFLALQTQNTTLNDIKQLLVSVQQNNQPTTANQILPTNTNQPKETRTLVNQTPKIDETFIVDKLISKNQKANNSSRQTTLHWQLANSIPTLSCNAIIKDTTVRQLNKNLRLTKIISYLFGFWLWLGVGTIITIVANIYANFHSLWYNYATALVCLGCMLVCICFAILSKITYKKIAMSLFANKENRQVLSNNHQLSIIQIQKINKKTKKINKIIIQDIVENPAMNELSKVFFVLGLFLPILLCVASIVFAFYFLVVTDIFWLFFVLFSCSHPIAFITLMILMISRELLQKPTQTQRQT